MHVVSVSNRSFKHDGVFIVSKQVHRFDTEALALAQRALGIIYNTATPGGDAQLLARLQNLLIEAMEHAAPPLSVSPQPVAWRCASGPFHATHVVTVHHEVAADWLRKGLKVEAMALLTSDKTPDDYFASLVTAARERAAEAMERYPQPNYVLNKVSEESGEVVKEVIHYAEGRGEWARVEDEIVDNLAMLFRLVVEGDQVIGFIPPYLKKDPADE